MACQSYLGIFEAELGGLVACLFRWFLFYQVLEEGGILLRVVLRVLVLIGGLICVDRFVGVWFYSTGSVQVEVYVFTGFGCVCLNRAVTRCGVVYN